MLHKLVGITAYLIVSLVQIFLFCLFSIYLFILRNSEFAIVYTSALINIINDRTCRGVNEQGQDCICKHISSNIKLTTFHLTTMFFLCFAFTLA